MKYQNEVISKFLEAPGLCSQEELHEVESFFKTYELVYKTLLDSMFRGDNKNIDFPVSLGYIESKVKECEWYSSHLMNKEKHLFRR